ncbi:RNA-directed DNA polymerase, eukaryota [Tanacetum coccineum]
MSGMKRRHRVRKWSELLLSILIAMIAEADIVVVRGGVETQQLENIQDLVRSKVLSNVDDRWAWDLNGSGDFCVKDARDLVDEVLLPKENVATRWIKTIPIKVNIFAWKLHLDRLPTRSNLLKRGIQSISFSSYMANGGTDSIGAAVDSYIGAWLSGLNSIRLGSKL